MKLLTVEEMRAAIAEQMAKENANKAVISDNRPAIVNIEKPIEEKIIDDSPKLVECEACDARVKEKDIIVHKTLKLCKECYDKEIALSKEHDSKAEERVAEYRSQASFVEGLNREVIENDKQLQKDVSKAEDFFNAEATDLALIEGTPFERAEKIRERIDKWGALLFEVQTKRNCDIAELNKVAANMRKEEREKLRLLNISYEPKEINVKPKEPVKRVSKEDKAIITMAQSLFGKKMLIGDGLLKQIHSKNSDWFDGQGLVKKEYQDVVNQMVQSQGGMTLESAHEAVRNMVRHSKAINFQNIAAGNIEKEK